MVNLDDLKQQAKRQARARDKEVEAFSRSLDLFLSRNLRKILRGIDDGKIRGAEAANLLGSIMVKLEQAGLEQVVNDIQDIYSAELLTIREHFREGTDQRPVFTASDVQDVETLIRFQEDRIYSTIENHVDDTKATLMQSIVTGQKATLDDLLDGASERAAANIKTELNTALMSFNRAVQARKAEELGFDLFIYTGPDDNVTRPFCEELLERDPPIYTIEEINAMDNGQDLPVLISGGGYNCRHDWRPISLELAKRLGYKFDDGGDNSEL